MTGRLLGSPFRLGVEGSMKLIKSVFLALGVLFAAQSFLHAQETKTTKDTTKTLAPGTSDNAQAPSATVSRPVVDLKAIGAGIIIVGAGLGICLVGRAAVESMARQPEIAGNIQTAMIIAAALIEGVTFFALLLQIIV